VKKDGGSGKDGGSEKQGAERRVFPRIPLLTEAWVIDEETGERTHVQTRDLSQGGLCIEAGENVWPPGRRLKLGLKLPEANEETVLNAKVAWVAGSLLGINFADLPQSEANLIRLSVELLLEEIESMESLKTPT